MLDQLLNLVKENAGDAIINNPAIPNEKNDEAISFATDGIINGLKSQLAGGNVSDVLQMLGGKTDVNNNPVTNAISNQVEGGLMEKFGLNKGAASSIVASLIPIVLSKLVSKTNNANDNSFDLNSIFSHLSGGKTQGMDIGSILGSVMGGGNSSGGGLASVLGNVLGGDKKQNQPSATGGLSNLMNIFSK
ncbi:MAG TPA: hypothetical protein PKN75_08835 [Bacteroidia bacterium]|nr:hypothetical protein [Bacteroidia bacterium]HNU33685.1 hypothetical protein [Bacteroidia bacterium]